MLSARNSEAQVSRCGQYGDKYSMRGDRSLFFPMTSITGRVSAGSADTTEETCAELIGEPGITACTLRSIGSRFALM
jgi:hypothetical protein